MRVGIGYDIHRFDGKSRRIGRGRRDERPLKLGGITIPFARGLSGHSDADVLLHAIADALLGAVGAGDLGARFPSSDPRYRNADSGMFVRSACEAVRRQGWIVGNLDATVIADAPRLTAYRARMAQRIGKLLGVDPADISVKAKTTEGFAPSQDGIAAHAVVLLKKKSSEKLKVGSGRKR